MQASKNKCKQTCSHTHVGSLTHLSGTGHGVASDTSHSEMSRLTRPIPKCHPRQTAKLGTAIRRNCTIGFRQPAARRTKIPILRSTRCELANINCTTSLNGRFKFGCRIPGIRKVQTCVQRRPRFFLQSGLMD